MDFLESRNTKDYLISFVKGGAILSILVISILVGIAPIKSKTFKHNVKLMGIFNAFSAGVFLSVGIIHLLPESNTVIYNYFKDNNSG